MPTFGFRINDVRADVDLEDPGARVIAKRLEAPSLLARAGEAATIAPLEPTFPWYVFHDYTATIETDGYSAAQRKQIAACGLGLWQAERLATAGGAAEIAAIRAINPHFLAVAIWSVLVVRASDPGASRPLWQDLYTLLTSRRAKHVDDAPVVSWPEPPAPTGDYWHTVLPANGGYLYDRALLEAATEIVRARLIEYLGGVEGVFFDYCNPHGPFVWPSELATHGQADLDDDGVGIGSDPAEGAAWDAWLEALAPRMKALLGSGLLVIPNGRAGLPPNDSATGNAAIASAVAGNNWEGWPALPWYNPRKSIELLHSAYLTGWYQGWRGRQWNLLGLRDDAATPHTDCARACSLIFQTPYFRQAAAGGPFYSDAHGIVAGDAIGDVVYVADVGSGVGEWSRAFARGVARVRCAARSGDGPAAGGGLVYAAWEPA